MDSPAHENIRKYRNMYDIVAAILGICSQGASRTNIMYRSKLNTKGLNEYLELLEQRGLIAPLGGKYQITERGREYLRSYESVVNTLGES